MGNPANYLFPENMEFDQTSLGWNYRGTQPLKPDVVGGSEGGKVLGVLIMRNSFKDISSSSFSASTAAASSKSEEKKAKKLNKKIASINVGTWNVSAMMRAAKLENIKREM